MRENHLKTSRDTKEGKDAVAGVKRTRTRRGEGLFDGGKEARGGMLRFLQTYLRKSRDGTCQNVVLKNPCMELRKTIAQQTHPHANFS